MCSTLQLHSALDLPSLQLLMRTTVATVLSGHVGVRLANAKLHLRGHLIDCVKDLVNLEQDPQMPEDVRAMGSSAFKAKLTDENRNWPHGSEEQQKVLAEGFEAVETYFTDSYDMKASARESFWRTMLARMDSTGARRTGATLNKYGRYRSVSETYDFLARG